MAALVVNKDITQAATRAAKDKDLSIKQEHLGRDFRRDLDKLEQKKRLLLG